MRNLQKAFSWETDRDASAIEISHAYPREGITNGYGFRYPDSKPGKFVCVLKGFSSIRLERIQSSIDPPENGPADIAKEWRESGSITSNCKLCLSH